MNRRQVLLLVASIAYVVLLSSIVPILISFFNLFEFIYDYFAELAGAGVFFVIYLMGTFFFFPFIYSTLIREKLSINIDKVNKKERNPRYYATILFLIGFPIMVWLILGNLEYYSITDNRGGLGIFILNGFLVCLITVFYFCIAPAIVLGLKKNRY